MTTTAAALVTLPLVLGGLTGLAISGDVRGAWYAALRKPAWQPPSWVFGPVWTALYLAMGVASALVYARVGWSAPMAAYFLQLALNIAWSWLFFRAKSLGAALADIVALLVVLFVTTRAFWAVSPLAGALLVPYVAWTAFATALTAALWRAQQRP